MLSDLPAGYSSHIYPPRVAGGRLCSMLSALLYPQGLGLRTCCGSRLPCRMAERLSEPGELRLAGWWVVGGRLRGKEAVIFCTAGLYMCWPCAVWVCAMARPRGGPQKRVCCVAAVLWVQQPMRNFPQLATAHAQLPPLASCCIMPSISNTITVSSC
jgi:hypothetical protein